MIAKLIGGFVAVIVGMSLLPSISTQFNLAIANQTAINSTMINGTIGLIPAGSAGANLLNTIPIAFAVGLAGIGIFIAWGALKEIGMFGDGEYDETDGMTGYNATGSVTGIMFNNAKQALESIEDKNRKVYKDTKPKHIEHDFGDREYKTDKADKTKFDDTTTKEKGKFEI